MSRPLISKSIFDLESAFSTSAGDLAFLQILEDELSHRSTKRAKRLKARVDALLARRMKKQSTELNTISESSPVSTKPAQSQTESLRNSAQGPNSVGAFSMTEDQKNRVREKVEHETYKKHSTEGLNILRAWTALEVLTPHVYGIPERNLIASLECDMLPWEGDGEKSRPNLRLYYEIVLGTIDLEKAVAALLDVYADERIERPSVKGKGLLVSIIVDRTGKLVGETATTISSFGWGLPKALQGDLSVLSEWIVAEQALVAGLEEIVRREDDDGNELPINRSVLHAAYEYIVEALSLPRYLINPPSFAVRTYKYYKSKDPPEPSLLNSFFLKDLEVAKQLLQNGKETPSLRAYLGLDRPFKRFDLLRDQGALDAAIAPEKIPPARWPGPERHSLVLLQQAAVNLAMSELKESGILAVNGPPGTGKTTLLRDILASVVTQRAEAMCEMDNPADAFETTGHKLRAGPAWLHFYKLSEQLKGHEVLIASSNNKAVENVSAELPGLRAIADDALDLRYFEPLATGLLNKDQAKYKDQEKKGWGLIAAVLGNTANVKRFKDIFWWDKHIGLSTYLAEASGKPQIIESKDEETGKVIDERQPEIIVACDAPDSEVQALKRWKNARKAFKKALAESKKTLGLLAQTRKALAELPSLGESEQSALSCLRDVQAHQSSTQMRFDEAEKSCAIAEQTLQDAQDSRNSHDTRKLGFFSRLLQRPVHRAWKKEKDRLSQVVRSLEEAHAQGLEAFTTAGTELAEAASQHSEKEAHYTSVMHTYTRARDLVNEMKAQLSQHFVDEDFFAQSHAETHMSTPWCDKNTQRLRDNVWG